ncbi:MAG: class II aldolase/adducin family protein [Acidobacteria bacterium]|nr:class II aldolase/adducin family protein [Acidobacteriota bacterium]
MSEPKGIEPGHNKTEVEHRRDICAVGRWVHGHSYVAATDGNISIRLDQRRVLATPTLMSKGMMAPDDLVVVDTKGGHLQGRRKASSEIAMHLLIYKRRPDVHAVVHAHPPTATGYAAAGLALNQALISEVVLALGCIPLARYGTPGTPELTEALAPLVAQYDAILMANHGVVTYGADLLTAYMRMETVEHFARISLVTQLLGGPNLLSREEVEKLGEARERYFGGTGAPVAPLTETCPVTSEPVHTCACGNHRGGGRDRFWVSREELEALIDEAVKSAKVRS